MTEPHAIADLVGQLRDRLPTAIKELEEQREQIDVELRSLRALSRTLLPNDKDKAPARTGRPRSKPSSETTLRVAEALASRSGEFTPIDVAAELEISEPLAYHAFNVLREMEFIAKVGTAPPIKKGAQGRALYRVLDTHVLDQLRSSQNAT